MLAFTVPPGIERIDVTLISPGFQKGMYLTAGLFDPQRYRGEGRSHFTVSTVDATGPYLPGPTIPGTWHITIGYNSSLLMPAATFTVPPSPSLTPSTSTGNERYGYHWLTWLDPLSTINPLKLFFYEEQR
jgi:hypothetical protein